MLARKAFCPITTACCSGVSCEIVTGVALIVFSPCPPSAKASVFGGAGVRTSLPRTYRPGCSEANPPASKEAGYRGGYRGGGFPLPILGFSCPEILKHGAQNPHQRQTQQRRDPRL